MNTSALMDDQDFWPTLTDHAILASLNTSSLRPALMVMQRTPAIIQQTS